MGKYMIDNAPECFTKVFGKQWIDKKINGILINWYMNKYELSRRLLLAAKTQSYIFILYSKISSFKTFQDIFYSEAWFQIKL